MKKIIKRFFEWIFKEELNQINKSLTRTNRLDSRIENILGNAEVSVDVDREYSSWAIISIKGQKNDYVKFISLGDSDIRGIQRYLSQFDRNNRKVDSPPFLTDRSNFFRL